jgi:glycosyltransferase involved in cell wall biosynthesis/SAM-dependent methyltransferase
MHGSVLGFFAYGALQAGEVAGRDVLEVGSLDVNGSIRPMVEARSPRSYVGVDVAQGPGVDRRVDVARLIDEFGPDAFDVVVSTECLEHVEDWVTAIRNMVRVLRPGGVLVWTTRSPGFAYHHPPDRWRYTSQAMAEILGRLNLEPMVVMDDPEYPGVFVKARKPTGWVWASLDGIDGVTEMREPRKWLGLPANPDGAGYYRMWQPWTQLQQHSGHEVLLPPPGAHDGISLNEDEVAAFDLVCQQRPNGRAILRDWRRWQGRTNLVYEADDNLLEPDPSGLPAWLDDTIQETVTECLRMASLVTVSTEPLAEVFRPHNPNVAVLPNCIHEDMLTIQRPRNEQVTVGWAGGATHLQDIALIQEPLTTILDKTPAGLHFLGMDYRSLFAGRGRWTGWQPDIWDYYQAVDFDIALCPLEPTAFNACRTPIKALEMAALGIPVVASDTLPYRDFVVDGVTGYLCRTPADWRARLRELVNDPQARQELGAKARQLATDHTIQQHWVRWARAYEGVCGR